MSYPNENSFSTVGLTFVDQDKDRKIQPDRDECIKSYMELTGKLKGPLEEIERLLSEYYDKNKYFPKKKALLFKWNVLRKRDSALVEVYFGGPVKEIAADAASNPKNQLPQPTPQVITYAMVGAPPTGPKDPRYPG